MSQNLLPKNLLIQLPLFSIISNRSLNNRIILAHFYNPIGFGNWYVVAGEKRGEDFVFYGITYFDRPTLGYFSLSELKNFDLPFNQKIKRDKEWKQKTVREVLTSLKRS